MPVVSCALTFGNFVCSQGRTNLVRRQLLHKVSVLSSLVLFMLRCVYVDLGVLKLYNIMSRGGVKNVKPVPQAGVPEPEIGASCINTTSGHLWR